MDGRDVQGLPASEWKPVGRRDVREGRSGGIGDRDRQLYLYQPVLLEDGPLDLHPAILQSCRLIYRKGCDILYNHDTMKIRVIQFNDVDPDTEWDPNFERELEISAKVQDKLKRSWEDGSLQKLVKLFKNFELTVGCNWPTHVLVVQQVVRNLSKLLSTVNVNSLRHRKLLR